MNKTYVDLHRIIIENWELVRLGNITYRNKFEYYSFVSNFNYLGIQNISLISLFFVAGFLKNNPSICV